MRACGKCVTRRRGKEGTGADADRGDASTDFVMVSALLALITVAILQVSYAFYVRNLLLDAASAGARYGTCTTVTPLRALTVPLRLFAVRSPVTMHRMFRTAKVLTLRGLECLR